MNFETEAGKRTRPAREKVKERVHEAQGAEEEHEADEDLSRHIYIYNCASTKWKQTENEKNRLERLN